MNCQFDYKQEKDTWWSYCCSVCGTTFRLPYEEPFIRSNCRGPSVTLRDRIDAVGKLDGALYDRLEQWMHSLGVHLKHYDKVKDKFGFPPSTCKQRKIWERKVVKFIKDKRHG